MHQSFRGPKAGKGSGGAPQPPGGSRKLPHTPSPPRSKVSGRNSRGPSISILFRDPNLSRNLQKPRENGRFWKRTMIENNGESTPGQRRKVKIGWHQKLRVFLVVSLKTMWDIKKLVFPLVISLETNLRKGTPQTTQTAKMTALSIANNWVAAKRCHWRADMPAVR